MIGASSIQLIILCDYETMTPECGFILLSRCPRRVLAAFKPCNITHSIPWPEPEGKTARKRRVGYQSLEVSAGSKKVRISISLQKKIMTWVNGKMVSPEPETEKEAIHESEDVEKSCETCYALSLDWQEIPLED
jgi:hypothetical protein